MNLFIKHPYLKDYICISVVNTMVNDHIDGYL